MKLLHIDSSISGEASVSRQLTAELVSTWRQKVPNLGITHRDLGVHPVPHMSGIYLAAQSGAAVAHTPEIQHDLAESSQILDEFISSVR